MEEVAEVAELAKSFSPRRGGFKVQQVQQIHKRPCLQEVSELLKVQQKCNRKCNKVQQGPRTRRKSAGPESEVTSSNRKKV